MPPGGAGLRFTGNPASLHAAITASDSDSTLKERLKVLLAGGGNANELNDALNTPLLETARMGYLSSLQLLLEYGADAGHRNRAGQRADEMVCTALQPSELSKTDIQPLKQKIFSLLEKARKYPTMVRNQALILTASKAKPSQGNTAEATSSAPVNPAAIITDNVSKPLEPTFTLDQRVFNHFKSGLSIKDATDNPSEMIRFLKDPDALEYFVFQLQNLLNTAQTQTDKDAIAIQLGEHYFHARGEEAVFFNKISQQVFHKSVKELAKDYQPLAYYLAVTSPAQENDSEPPENKTKGLSAITGMDDLKQKLSNQVIFPLRHHMSTDSEEMKRKVHRPNGLLLYGPPGCGKTFVAEKLAEELNIPFFEMSYDEVVSPYHGVTLKNIRRKFKKALENAPSIFVINEIDDFLANRTLADASQQHVVKEVNQMLRTLDGLGEKGVLVIGTTNHLQSLDQAGKRAKRFDLKIEVPPPDKTMRAALFRAFLDTPVREGMPLIEEDFSSLAEKTPNYAIADIELICKLATNAAILAGELKSVPVEYVLKAIGEVKSSLGEETRIQLPAPSGGEPVNG